MRKKRYLKIQDCFEFLCPEKWTELDSTSTRGVKHCGVCDKNVYKATNKAQLLELGKQGKCAAYFENEEMLIGMINPESEIKFDLEAGERFKKTMGKEK